ncbi:retinol dehydrogenase 12-like isoform X2 [Arctopsyche grandis]|uniref:retinol dehydrogenase 12-like isoform X2 n=1 Tax=Arctopsyche grandis TaxID=121162 RepID=UPI00406D90C4
MPLFSGRCYSLARLDGITAVITGCNTGIGKETALDFYKRGARVLMACRDLTKANSAKEDIVKSSGNIDGCGDLVVVKLDLLSLSSVRECAKYILNTEPKINLLINNAGVMMCPKGKTEDGFEIQLGTNHLAHFLLTLLLFPRIANSKPARIVNVSSTAHERYIDFNDIHFEQRNYSPFQAYAQSKLANVLFTKELAKKIQENNIDGVNVYSLHPGVISTELGRHFATSHPIIQLILKPFRWFMKTPEMGAQTTIYCAVDEKCAEENGLYYKDCVAVEAAKEALNLETAEKFWNLSEKLVGFVNWNPSTADNKM